jgi:hypothetical protein
MPPPRNPATRTLRDEDVVSERRLPHPSVAREALERAVRREEARARRDLVELPRTGADPELAELDPPLAAE